MSDAELDSTDYENNSQNRKRIHTLVKRRNHLAARTNSNPSLTYDIAERKSLDWAIRVLEQLLSERERIDDSVLNPPL